MNRLFDLRVPFFLPLWRRVVVVAVCLGWALFEFSGGAVFWGILFGASGLYAGWALLVTFDAEAVAARQREEEGESR